MKEKSKILKQINSFKNRVIKGSNEKSLLNKKVDINALQYKIESNIILSNNATYYEPRNNTTAPNTGKKKPIKNNNHVKITAKNKELQNLYTSNIKIYKDNVYIDKMLSKKTLAKSMTKNPQKNVYPNKKSNNTHNIKRMNSSNNITIADNNAIDFFTKKMLEGTKSSDSIGRDSVSPIDQLKDSNLVQNDQMGLFSIKLHSNNVDFDDINKNNTKKIRLSKHKENNTKSNKSISNTTSFTNNMNANIQKKKSVKDMSPSILHNLNAAYKCKRSSSVDMEANKINNNNNNDKESKKFNGLISEEAKIKKIIKNNNKNRRILEDEKNKEKNNKNIMAKIKNEQLSNYNRNIYQYLILKGNASYLVKYCMYHRINWVEAVNHDQENSNIFNFKWKETSHGIDYYNLNKNIKMKQMVNHFEFHCVISNKANLFINLMKYCEKRNLSLFKFVPFTIVFKLKDKRKIKNKEKQKRWNEKLEKLETFIQQIEKNVKKYNDIGQYFNNEEYIKDKEKREEFEREKLMKKLIKKQLKEEEKDYKSKDKKIDDEKYKGQFEVYSDVFPRLKTSDKVSKKNKLNEEKEIKFNKIIGSNTLIEIPDTHYKGKNMWVIKAINLNRGMCIKVVNSFEQMIKVINKFKGGVDYNNFTLEKIEEEQKVEKVADKVPNQEDNCVNSDQNKTLTIENKNNSQKLVSIEETPIEKNENTKVDENAKKNDEKENEKEEKVYNCTKILIQKYIENPLLYKGRKCDMRIWVLLTHQMKVFLFKEGHLKTCSIEYDINSKDAFTHITNYSFQKHNTNFQKFEKGNEVPFYEFQKFIDEKYPEKNYKLNKDLMVQLKEIIKHTMKCGKKKINKNNRNFQFEIFGYDFMLDNDFNAFLIEINTNPGLEISSPWIQIIIPRMLDDALRLTVDKVFDPVYDFSKNYKGDFTDEQKKLLIDSKIEYDFNAVNPIKQINQIDKNNDSIKDNKPNNNNAKESSSLSSSVLTKISTPSDKKYDSNILNINLDLDEFDKNIIKPDLKDQDKDKESEKKEEHKDNDKLINDEKNEGNKKTKNFEEKKESKINKKKKVKYISPFPVPGYTLDENLWDFVCDLNDKEETETIKEKDNKDNTDKNSFTGIRHLLKKRKNKSKTKILKK